MCCELCTKLTYSPIGSACCGTVMRLPPSYSSVPCPKPKGPGADHWRPAPEASPAPSDRPACDSLPPPALKLSRFQHNVQGPDTKQVGTSITGCSRPVTTKMNAAYPLSIDTKHVATNQQQQERQLKYTVMLHFNCRTVHCADIDLIRRKR